MSTSPDNPEQMPGPLAESRELPTPDASPDEHHFPIVGVGASAGGLEAFTELLRHIPPNSGLAFLFVQHLEPHHKSELPSILGNLTSMPVLEASEGMSVEVDRVYVIPPNMSLALTDGTLTLTPRQAVPGPHMPVDYLFRSLAGVLKGRAVGVILSGGGTDGTLGFQAIKAEGGITFAQDGKTARHDSMPRSAIVDGWVDYVLPPAEIALHLVRLARHPYAREAERPIPAIPEIGEALDGIMNLLRSGTTVDFTHYKRSTIRRRILRRMALHNFEDVNDYLAFLREDASELNALYQDFLIRVTHFFRDSEVFEALRERVFPQLTQDRTAENPLRIWVAGCATGEEVYSLAISLLEFLGSRADPIPVKILATDINNATLEKARAGVYPDNIEMDVSQERLRHFFVRIDHHYQISKTVRDLCVFSRHNFTNDPPFSHLDLISCRNVLIYLDLALQKRVLPVFHYALNPNGFLLLGTSESIAGAHDLFGQVDAHNRIFIKKNASTRSHFDLSSFSRLALPMESLPRDREKGDILWTALDVQKEADRLVLSRYSPVGVVIDEALSVLQFRGRTSAYLEPAPGLASLDLLKMLREGLLAEAALGHQPGQGRE